MLAFDLESEIVDQEEKKSFTLVNATFEPAA